MEVHPICMFCKMDFPFSWTIHEHAKKYSSFTVVLSHFSADILVFLAPVFLTMYKNGHPGHVT